MLKVITIFISSLFIVNAQANDERPNIILVMADDQGYGDAGYTGHPIVQTPNLDAMAKVAVVFNRFYAAAPVCSPTRASVLTGRHPFRTNVPNHGHYMRPQEVTLAESLHTAGYVTGHFGKWHIGSVQPDSPTCPGKCGFDEWLTGLNFFDIDPYLSKNGKYVQIKGQGSTISMDATLEFLKKHKDGAKPMFAVTWFPAPHTPHKEIADPELYKGNKNRGYYQEITHLDAQVGRLRKTLRDLKIAENTIVWYCSDNGGLLKESSGGRDKKGSIYEGGLRVPCLVEWPKKWQHKVITTPASTSDIFPTLLEITKIKNEKQPKLDGVSLVNIIAGTQTKRAPIGFWHEHTHGQATFSDRVIKELMVAQNNGKPTPHPGRLLKNINEPPKFPNGTPFHGHAAWLDWPWKLHRIQSKENPKEIKLMLYNLEKDPMETTFATDEKVLERIMKMTKQLEAWQRSVYDSWEGQDYLREGIK